jgi:lipid-binding SYLF domain-containing protein
MTVKILISLLLAAVVGLGGCQTTGGKPPESTAAAQIDRDVDLTLTKLYDSVPSATVLARQANGILVFPRIVKGGFVVGAHYGRGALRQGDHTAGYYSTLAASYGLQAGIQSFGYVLFFMNEDALSYLDSSGGWEVGVGPSIVILDHGKARAITTTTLKHDIYALIFDQRGLMAGLGLQGSKITRINP